MKINGKVHCFFEQSGTFKNEFIKLGIPAEDYDIQNNFGETDHQDDLFRAIEDAYEGKPSLFDNITGGGRRPYSGLLPLHIFLRVFAMRFQVLAFQLSQALDKRDDREDIGKNEE